MKLSRRYFLLAFVVFAITIVGGLMTLLPWKFILKRMIKNDTAELNYDPVILDQFLEDAAKEKLWKPYTFVKQMIIRCYSFFPIPFLPYFDKYVQYRNNITGQFLGSTDFFRNKMDESRTLTYSGIYNPYKSPCSVPFSSMFYA